jgi:hypothetical protein
VGKGLLSQMGENRPLLFRIPVVVEWAVEHCIFWIQQYICVPCPDFSPANPNLIDHKMVQSGKRHRCLSHDPLFSVGMFCHISKLQTLGIELTCPGTQCLQ